MTQYVFKFISNNIMRHLFLDKTPFLLKKASAVEVNSAQDVPSAVPVWKSSVQIKPQPNYVPIDGYGGNGAASKGKALHQIENCSDFTLTNFGYRGGMENDWYMLEQKTSDGKVIRVPTTDFFTLYKQDY